MIDFRNKYLTLAAMLVAAYFVFNGVKGYKSYDSPSVSGKDAKFSVVIDPYKKKDDYSIIEKMALLSAPKDALQKLETAKKEIYPPGDLYVRKGDKVFIEIEKMDSNSDLVRSSHSIKIGEESKNIEQFLQDALYGMKMSEIKEVVNPKNTNDIRKIRILYIERFKNPRIENGQ